MSIEMLKAFALMNFIFILILSVFLLFIVEISKPEFFLILFSLFVSISFIIYILVKRKGSSH